LPVLERKAATSGPGGAVVRRVNGAGTPNGHISNNTRDASRRIFETSFA
jgi:hypothetical protein